MAAGCDPASAKPKNVVVDRKKSAGDAKLHCEINGKVPASADFLRCGGSLSDFLHWCADATAIIGTLSSERRWPTATGAAGAYPADRTAAPNGHRPPYRPLDGDIGCGDNA